MSHRRAYGIMASAALSILPFGCATTDDYPVVPPQPVTEDPQPLPPATIDALRLCVKQSAPRLERHAYHLQFALGVTEQGQVQKTSLVVSNVERDEVDQCMEKVLQGTTIPEYIVARLRVTQPVSSFPGAPPSRGLVGVAWAIPAKVIEVAIIYGGMTVVVAISLSILMAGAKALDEAITTATTEVVDSPKEQRMRCNEQMTECLDTVIASRPGSLWNHSQCLACEDVCMQNRGVWPSRISLSGRSVSCEYWKLKK